MALISSLEVNDEPYLEDAYHVAYQVLIEEIQSNQAPSKSESSGFGMVSKPSVTTNEQQPEVNKIESIMETGLKKHPEVPEWEKGALYMAELSEIKPKYLPHKQNIKKGTSAIGISVLMAEGWIRNINNPPSYLRHDSGADISLISLEYYRTLKNPPAIKTGMRNELWQLTDKESKIEGYVTMPIFTMSEWGELIETEVKAYLVPNMSVPILLGEDYQVNYELTIK